MNQFSHSFSLYPYSTYLIADSRTDSLAPEYSFKEKEEKFNDYVNSHYWTDNEADAWWYWCIYFPYFFQGNKAECLKKIRRIFILLNLNFSDYYNDDEAIAVFDEVEPFRVTDNRNKELTIYSIEVILMRFAKKLSATYKTKIQARFKWAAELRKAREETQFTTPNQLKYCISKDRTRQMGLVTLKNIKAIFNLKEKKLQEKLSNSYAVKINGCTYYNLSEVINELVTKRLLNDEYYNIDNYTDKDAKSSCHYLLYALVEKVILETQYDPIPETIAFCDFDRYGVNKREVLQAALSGKLDIYIDGKVSLSNNHYGTTHYIDNCDLLYDKAPRNVVNERYKVLSKLKISGVTRYVGEYTLRCKEGFTVEMLFQHQKPKAIIKNPGDIPTLEIVCQPTEVEQAYGIKSMVSWHKDLVDHYLEHVVIIKKEWDKLSTKDTKKVIRKNSIHTIIKKAINDLILSQTNKKVFPTTLEVWNRIKEHYVDKEIAIAKVDDWNNHEACIYWSSAKTTNRTLSKATFSNIISEFRTGKRILD